MYNMRHGGPYDRGSADKHYGRDYDPHYYVEDTYSSDRVELENMTPAEIAEYTAGYRDCTSEKEWD